VKKINPPAVSAYLQGLLPPYGSRMRMPCKWLVYRIYLCSDYTPLIRHPGSLDRSACWRGGSNHGAQAKRDCRKALPPPPPRLATYLACTD
jgi:hypothetical protein